MKGRRKIKTDKWLMMQQFIEEARSVLAQRAAHRAEALPLFWPPEKTVEEPVGMLTGIPAVVDTRTGRKRKGRKVSD